MVKTEKFTSNMRGNIGETFSNSKIVKKYFAGDI